MYINNINNNFKTLIKIFKIIIYKNKITIGDKKNAD